MAMVPKFSNFRDELSENDELREFELSGSDCIGSQGPNDKNWRPSINHENIFDKL